MLDVYRQTSQREAGPGERAQSVSIPHTSMRVGTLVPMIQRKGGCSRHICDPHREGGKGAGGTAQQLRARAALAEDQASVPGSQQPHGS